MNKKFRILIFIDWFSPGYKAGGPIASCINFIQLMKDDYTLYVLTSDTDLGETIPYKNITAGKWISSGTGDCMIFYTESKKPVLKQIRAAVTYVNPDFVYLNHLFSPKFVVYPLWLKWKGFIDCKVIVAPRGAVYESALSVKPYKKIPFMKLFRWMGIHKKVRFHATSDREQNALLQYFPHSEVFVADDLPNTKQPAFKTIQKEKASVKCIFIARIHPIKNLLFLLSAIAQVKEKVQLTIIGPVEDEVYWKQCQEQIKTLAQNIEVVYEGALPNHELLPVLQNHHLFILPTKGENFGHSIFEAMLAGRPVLISDQTPWLQLQTVKAGWDLSLSLPEDFAAIIEMVASWDQATFDQWALGAWTCARKFIENPELKKNYLQLFS